MTLELVRRAVALTTSYQRAAVLLGVSRQSLTALVTANNIDISHFRPGRARFSKVESILRRGSTATRGCVRATVRRLGLLKEECACGISTIWNCKPLVLELDHIDGDRTNCELSNLRFLCPNCHSQTPHHRGRSKKRYAS